MKKDAPPRRLTRKELLHMSDVYANPGIKLAFRCAAGDEVGEELLELDFAGVEVKVYESSPVARASLEAVLKDTKSNTLKKLLASLTGGPKLTAREYRTLDSMLFWAEGIGA